MLDDTKLSELRVADRVKKGGHYVDPATVAANFYGNLEKLNQHYTMFDSVQIVDTSKVAHGLLAVFRNGVLEGGVSFSELPGWFRENLKNLAQQMA